MAIGLIGRKCGMTRVFNSVGRGIPVTVLEVLPNRVVQVKTKDKDGYSAVQVTCGSKRNTKVNKALAGHYKKAGVEAGWGLWEFSIDGGEQIDVGAEFKVDTFKEGMKIDVTSTSKGKGFAGVVKRHHFSTQDASHGNSLSHRAPGSTGQRQDPGKVFKGKKMPGHLGNVRSAIQNQEVIKIDTERNLLFIKGGVPGAIGVYVIVQLAKKINESK